MWSERNANNDYPHRSITWVVSKGVGNGTHRSKEVGITRKITKHIESIVNFRMCPNTAIVGEDYGGV